MSSRAKFQNNSFVRHTVSSTNAKRTFLLLEPPLEDFSKILFYGSKASHDISLCLKFHNRQPNSLVTEESRINHRIGRITSSLAKRCLLKSLKE